MGLFHAGDAQRLGYPIGVDFCHGCSCVGCSRGDGCILAWPHARESMDAAVARANRLLRGQPARRSGGRLASVTPEPAHCAGWRP